MARKNSAIQRLLAEARRKEKNAGSKVSRLNLKGLQIRGSAQDPRVGARRLATYSVRELQKHIKALDEFTSRNNSYIAGASGSIIPLHKWEQYKALEQRYNNKVDSRLSQRGEIKLPNKGMTIRDRAENILPDSLRARGEINQAPFSNKLNRVARNVEGVEAVDKLISDMQRKLDRKYLPERISEQRREAAEMLKLIGNPDLDKAFNELSNYQFDILFNDYGAVIELAKSYALIKMGALEADDPARARMVEDEVEDLWTAVDWAKKLPKKALARKQARPARTSRRL